MATPDAQHRLAYLDVGPLLTMLQADWELFADALIDQDVWLGRVMELHNIRNRIGHCRRPHPDDLARLEQTLRDLEPGAFRALAAFNRQRHPDNNLPDPLVEAWVRHQHQVARRLVAHAESQYNTGFVLRYSRRPWAQPNGPATPITGAVGYLWHAAWYLGGGYLDLRGFWEDVLLDPHCDLVVFVCANSPTDLAVSFAAVDEPTAIADAIGNCFDKVLFHMRRGPVPRDLWDTWGKRQADLDQRVQVQTGWSIVDDSTTPVTIFDA